MTEINEIWKPVVGYEGLYEISSMGRVNSLGRWGKGRNGSMKYHKGGLLNVCYDNNGYKCVVLSKEGKPKKCRIHRLIAEAFIPNYRLPYFINLCHITNIQKISLKTKLQKYL